MEKTSPPQIYTLHGKELLFDVPEKHNASKYYKRLVMGSHMSGLDCAELPKVESPYLHHAGRV